MAQISGPRPEVWSHGMTAMEATCSQPHDTWPQTQTCRLPPCFYQNRSALFKDQGSTWKNSTVCNYAHASSYKILWWSACKRACPNENWDFETFNHFDENKTRIQILKRIGKFQITSHHSNNRQMAKTAWLLWHEWKVLLVWSGTFWWFSARLQYLQCVSNGDTAVLHWAIDLYFSQMVFSKICLSPLSEKCPRTASKAAAMWMAWGLSDQEEVSLNF